MNYKDYKTKTSLILPFRGIWVVGNGGRDPEKNSHFNPNGDGPQSQQYAYDFFSKYLKGPGNKLEDFEAFGAEVIAPAAGIICQIVDGSIDVPIGETDLFVFTGNMIIIDHENGEWSVLCHLKYNSIKVKVGDAVKQGEVLGLCGNTGNSSEPHIHYHLQDNASLHKATGLPTRFKTIKVDGEIKKRFVPELNQKVENI